MTKKIQNPESTTAILACERLLKKCPCCGGEAKIAYDYSVRHPLASGIVGVYGINCIGCGLATPNCYSLDPIVTTWNARVSN